MIPIEFGKVYRRLDSSVRFLSISAMNQQPSIELIDNDPQYAVSQPTPEDPPVGSYLPKGVKIYASNKNVKPTGSSEMSLSDTVLTGVGHPQNTVNNIIGAGITSTWVLFEKANPSDDISAYAVDFFIRNLETFNDVSGNEVV